MNLRVVQKKFKDLPGYSPERILVTRVSKTGWDFCITTVRQNQLVAHKCSEPLQWLSYYAFYLASGEHPTYALFDLRGCSQSLTMSTPVTIKNGELNVDMQDLFDELQHIQQKHNERGYWKPSTKPYQYV